MANPGILTDWQASNTLLANLQIIKPEKSRVRTGIRHRRCDSWSKAAAPTPPSMARKSDTASRRFRDHAQLDLDHHGNEGDGPMIWLDGLDVPLIQALEANFFELYPEKKYPLSNPDELSLRLFGSGSLRPTWIRHDALHSPLLNYKFAPTYAALKAMAERSDGSPYDGVSVEYTNPLTGGPAIATMTCFASLLRPAQRTKAHRHTGGMICHVIKGKGRSVIGGKSFEWDEKDTFVIPSWTHHEHEAATESVLFSYSDAAVLQPLGLYREEALQENNGHQKVEGTFEPLPVPVRAGG